MLAARLAVTLDASIARFFHGADQNLGHLETQALHDVQTLLRTALQHAAQAKADATPPRQLELTVEPYQMILQVDAWSLRERDACGPSAPLRRHGTEPER